MVRRRDLECQNISIHNNVRSNVTSAINHSGIVLSIRINLEVITRAMLESQGRWQVLFASQTNNSNDNWIGIGYSVASSPSTSQLLSVNYSIRDIFGAESRIRFFSLLRLSFPLHVGLRSTVSPNVLQQLTSIKRQTTKLKWIKYILGPSRLCNPSSTWPTQTVLPPRDSLPT